jgi:hypothetical protein
MGCDIPQFQRAIAGNGDHRAGSDDRRPDWHLAARRGPLGFPQRAVHETAHNPIHLASRAPVCYEST